MWVEITYPFLNFKGCTTAWHLYMGLFPDTLNRGLRMRREWREHFPRHRLQGKPLVSDPSMHHGTCMTHVPWCMPGSIIRGAGKTFPAFPSHEQHAILRIWQEAHWDGSWSLSLFCECSRGNFECGNFRPISAKCSGANLSTANTAPMRLSREEYSCIVILYLFLTLICCFSLWVYFIVRDSLKNVAVLDPIKFD